jgi:omega-6 fatty acid desaturase (delta-12 desaturase)
MNDMSSVHTLKAQETSTKDWLRVLAKYRQPNNWRSVFELAITMVGFFGCWALAWASISFSYFLTGLLGVLGGGFLVRLFTLQHDCGHGSLFSSRTANDWVGRCLGVLTLTPYALWRRTHSIHHANSGNLEKRGIGDIYTMTVAEYKADTRWGRFMYRLYRSPFTIFVVGPVYIFGIQQRLPVGMMKAGIKYWISTMGTTAMMLVTYAVLIYMIGFWQFFAVFAITSFTAAAAGMWLFYVQHQFEETHWDQPEEWDMHDAALYGSSYYALPKPLQWISGNIGIHHVHHLYSRIPFYRLPEVLRDYPVLGEIKRLGFWESLKCANLHLWDEGQRRLVRFKEVRLNR